MSLRIRGRLRSRKKRLRDVGQDPGLEQERAQVQVGDQRRVGPQEEQHGLRAATEARQVAVTVASDEVEDAATTAHAADQPVSRAVAASAAAAWEGSVRWSGLPPRLSCHHT